MSEPLTKTLDGSEVQSFAGFAKALWRGDELRPRLRLLHHLDPKRIGACSRADAALATGEGLTVGRTEPLFVEPGPDGWERPLEDPRISRRQLVVRFVAERGVFVVEPHPEGKRRLGVWQKGAGIRELSRRVEVPPGAAIAIEDRVLVGLELAKEARSKDEDRLGLVGESEAVWRLREQIGEAARFGHPVLVLGETGSGKERVAQAIHGKSARRDRPLVVVNCAALPESLSESLLFGHVKGAFTGAAADREGYFRAAHGGTLFLDELGEMPVSVQPKLLRTLQDGLVTPVGRHDAVGVDVRVIAATNRDPARAIADGRLREDLYHRLAGHVIRVPPLAERPFDVPELFVAFLEAWCRAQPGPTWLFRPSASGRPTVPLAFVLSLLEAPWSGNVRELKNAAELCARKNVDATEFRAPEGLFVGEQPLLVSRPSEPVRAEPGPPAVPSAEASALPASGGVEARAPASSGVEAGAATAPSAPAGREHLARASQVLDLAQKTVAKLFDAAELRALVTDTSGDSEGRLRAAAAERLLVMLERHDFEQRALAAELSCSPATLVKLMQRFGIPRALDLDDAAIRLALDAENGDVEAAARRLRVSAQGLKKRLVLQRLRS